MKILINTIAEPLMRRFGTFMATFLAAQGVPDDTITSIVTGVTALALVAVDLLLANRYTKKIQRGQK